MTRIIILLLAFALFACKENEPSVSKQDVILESLQGTWTVSEVRLNNALISNYSDFTFTINDKSYTTEKGAPVWPNSGSFDFVNTETENAFIRVDGSVFTATIQGDMLMITILYQEENARGIYGTYNFLME